jgi:hypothetical protein
MNRRDELLEREKAAWDALLAAVHRVPADRRREPGVVPGWSVQDLVWHCGRWAGWVVIALERIHSRAADGSDLPEPVWQGLNDEWAEESREMSWEAVESGAEAERARAREVFAAIDEVTDEEASEFSEETFVHYEDHRVEIERFVDRPA